MPRVFNHSKKNFQRGATLVELMAVFALIVIITPFIFKRGMEKSNEIKNIAYARDMQIVGQAVHFYMENNFFELAARSAPLVLNDQSPEIAPYLPTTFQLDAKNYSKIHISVLSDIRGQNVYLSAVLIGEEISEFNEFRVKQIANLIGAEGGFTQGNKAISVTGSYSVPLSDYSLTAADFHLAMVVSYTRMEVPAFLAAPRPPSDSDNFLWRKNAALYGYESWRNKMETDLLMGEDNANFLPIENVNLIEMVDSSGNRTITIDGEKGIDMAGLKITNVGSIFFKKNTDSGTQPVLTIDGKGVLTGDQDVRARTILPESGAGDLRRGGDITLVADDRTYRIDPENVSILFDLRVEEFGNATVSDLLGNYQLRNIIPDAQTNDEDEFGKFLYVNAPGFDTTERGPLKNARCPAGYAPTIIVSPVATLSGGLQVVRDGDTTYFTTAKKTIRGEEIAVRDTPRGKSRVDGEDLENISKHVPVYVDPLTQEATYVVLDAKEDGSFFVKTEPVNQTVTQPDATTRLETVGWRVYTNAQKLDINVYCKRAIE